MKRIILGVLCALLVAVTACHVTHGGRVGQQPDLINQYGEWRCFPELWVIADASQGKISVKRLERDGWTLQTAADWRTGQGWFVFAENAQRIWIYNGDSLRLLLITPQIGSAIYQK